MSEIYDNTPVEDDVNNTRAACACLDDFAESPLGDYCDWILLLARCVGVLVTISAILTGLILMITMRVSLMYATESMGCVGILAILAFGIRFAARSRKESSQIVSKIINIYSHSCW